jgi:hypothetical protein
LLNQTGNVVLSVLVAGLIERRPPLLCPPPYDGGGLERAP